jgi:hypothetical protein
MRRPPQLGQKPRPLHENGTNRSSALRAPQAREPVRQDTTRKEVAELPLHEGRQRHAFRLPPGRLQEGDEVLVDHAVQHCVLGVARPVVADTARHGGDIGAPREHPQCPVMDTPQRWGAQRD